MSAAPVYSVQGPNGFVPPSDPPTDTLSAGAVVQVAEGPRHIGGATWYLVIPTPSTSDVWLRVDAAGAVQIVAPACPSTQAGALSMEAWDRLTCLGSNPVTAAGLMGHCQGGVVLAEPEWLAYGCWNLEGDSFSFDVHATPSSGINFPDAIVRAQVTGHFDDPASATCRSTADYSEAWFVVSPEEQILLCREAFVVDKLQILEVLNPSPAA